MNEINESVEIFVDKIDNGKCVIFCGAGISLSSKILTVKPLLEQLLQYLNADGEDIKKYLYPEDNFHLPMPFEAIIQSLKNNVRFTNSDTSFIEVFAHLFEGKPNINHYLLANLLREKKIHCIVTTNFDTCLEQALGWGEGDDRIIIPYKEELEYLEDVDLEGKIIKIHGCKTVPDLLGTTVSQITRPFFLQKTNLVLSRLFCSNVFDTVLFLGYSCSDKWDISEFFHNCKINSVPISLCIYWQHTNQISEEQVELNVKEMLDNHYHIYLFGDTSELIRNLWANYEYGQLPENAFSEPNFSLKEYITEDTDLVLNQLFQDSNMHHLAKKYCLRAIELYNNHLTDDPQKYMYKFIKAIADFGDYYMAVNDTTNAENFYGAAIQYSLDNYTFDKENLSVMLIDLFVKFADALVDNGKTEEAEKHYLLAINFYLESELFIPPLAVVYNSVALLYEKIESEKAYTYYHKALDIYAAYAKEDPLEYAPDEAMTLNNIAMLYWRNNELIKAIPYMEHSLEIYRKLAVANELFKEDIGKGLNNLGLIYHELGRFDDAQKAYIEAIDIQRKLVSVFPERHSVKLALSLSNLSNLYVENQLMEAKKQQKEALEIRQKLAEDSTPMALRDWAHSLLNMGNISYKLDEFEQARVYLQEALPVCRNLVKINEKQYLEDLANALILYCNISEETDSQKQTDESYSELLDIADRLFHWNKKEYADLYAHICFNFANYKYRNNYAKEAMEYYQKAMVTYNKLLKDQPDDYYRRNIECYHKLISTINPEELNPLLNEAFSNMCQSITLFIQNSPEQLPAEYVDDLVTVALNLGVINYDNGNLGKSKRIYKKALEINDLCCLTNNYQHTVNQAKLFCELANVFSLEASLDNNDRLVQKTEKTYLHAFSAYEKVSGQLDEHEQLNYSILLTRLSNFYQKVNDIDSAIAYFERSVQSYETLCQISAKIEYLQRLSNAKYDLYKALINKSDIRLMQRAEECLLSMLKTSSQISGIDSHYNYWLGGARITIAEFYRDYVIKRAESIDFAKQASDVFSMYDNDSDIDISIEYNMDRIKQVLEYWDKN